MSLPIADAQASLLSSRLRRLRIGNGNDAIAMRATTHRDDGEVHRVVEIIVVVIARHAIAIIVDNDKTPAHR